ncbi:MAG: hypothetical protein ABJN69_02685 [Hellea sp.]
MSEFVEDKVIFEGQVLGTIWLGDETDSPMENSETTFKLIKPYIGPSNSKTKVQHHSQGPACGMYYVMGNKSLITAYKNSKDAITTNSCTSNAVPEITLLDYFENNNDIYIPSRRECPDEQIDNLDDPKNCHFWSDEAAKQRREAMNLRWRKKREEAKKKGN